MRRKFWSALGASFLCAPFTDQGERAYPKLPPPVRCILSRIPPTPTSTSTSTSTSTPTLNAYDYAAALRTNRKTFYAGGLASFEGEARLRYLDTQVLYG